MYRITAINGSSRTIIHETDTDSSIRLASGQFAEEVNQIPSFDFTMLPSNPCYSEGLSDRKTIVEIYNTIARETEFEGPLLRSGNKMTASGKVYKSCICEGYLGYLCDSIQPYHHYDNYTITDFVTALLDNHNAQVSEEKRIYLGLCDFSSDNTNSKTTAYRNTLEEIKVNLIDRIGGEVRIRKVDGRLVLDFLTQYGVKCDTAIELSKNIQSLEVSSDSTNIITRLITLGYQIDPGESAERLDISSVNDGKMYIDDEAAIAKYGIIVGTATFDDITVPENLLNAGREYLANNNRIKKAYAGQVLDLSVIDASQQSIKAGNTYRFRNKLIGLNEDLRLMKRTVDIYKPYKPNVEIGDKAERITDVATRTAQLIEYEIPKQKLDILASAKATATDLIRAGISGYVVVNENEICIMDTPNKETATKVWRWNSGGFGYSNTGYDGEYGTAMTMNGAIVADFITAGVLRGLEIVNGDGTFHVDTDGNVTATSIDINNGNGTFHVHDDGSVDASAINITGGSINIETSSESLSVIDLSYSGNRSYQNVMAAYGSVLTDNTNHTFNTAMQLFPTGLNLFSGSPENRTFRADSATGSITSQGGITCEGGITTHGNLTVGDNLLYRSGDGYYNLTTYLKTDAVSSTTLKTDTVSATTVNAETLIYNRNGDWYNLGATINNIYDRLSALEGV